MFQRAFLIASILALSRVNGIYTDGSIVAPCDSPVYCYGDLLRQVELARPFSDSKTFVDLPTTQPLSAVLEAFQNLTLPLSNDTQLQNFLSTYFGDAGSELEAIPPEELSTDPTFLEHVQDVKIREFVEKVVGIWPDLTRRYKGPEGGCDGCVDSFIPVDRSFVVAGGRFREPYYWDSFWVVEGLLRTQGSFTEIARNIIENFLDLVEQIGFVPNGARVYYLNRSQPPVLTQMVKVYVEYTNDTSLLERALPILIKEYDFWTTNRTVDIEAYGTTYTLNRYNVNNNQPRPESYREDYITATNTTYLNEDGEEYTARINLSPEEQALLYSDLASGAESGWDYTSRWISSLDDATSHRSFPLRTLNTQNIIPVDLNSILYANEIAIASFLSSTGDGAAATEWTDRASQRSQAMYDLMWSPEHFGYFDYNLTSSSQNLYTLADNSTSPLEASAAPEGHALAFSIAQFYPFWTGAAPASILQNPSLMRRVYTRVADILDRKPGGIGATNLRTGQQWDEPNVWPPLQYILLKGLLSVPPTSGTEGDAGADYRWIHSTALRLAQRYVSSTYCTWRATGGSSASNPQLEDLDIEDGAQGIMFEKYSEDDINVAGGGGEYEVVEGFGWTNGVLIWVADVLGQEIELPDCEAQGGGARRRKRASDSVRRADEGNWGKRAVELDRGDTLKVRKWGEGTKL